MVAHRFVGIREKLARGSVGGSLWTGEDRVALLAALGEAPEWVLAGAVPLLVHGDLSVPRDEAERTAQRERKREALRQGCLKRYVFALRTTAGPRIIKVAETTSVGNALYGLVHSVAWREHRHQQRAEVLDLAVSETVGYLEWRRGLRLKRAIQIQTPMRADLETLASFLIREGEARGEAAWVRFGAALAQTHRVPFFHADLKGFHAWVQQLGAASEQQPAYRLRWLDLARVSFHLTRRKRIINLYQALRFLVPARPGAQQSFVHGYCRAAGWYADNPDAALAIVQRFLARKYRTHPVVE